MNRFQRTSIVTPLFFRLTTVLLRSASSSPYCCRSEKDITWPNHVSVRKTALSQERNRNIDKAALFVVGYSTQEWACLKERLLETKRLTIIEAAQ
jgi:hypothetical protein